MTRSPRSMASWAVRIGSSSAASGSRSLTERAGDHAAVAVVPRVGGADRPAERDVEPVQRGLLQDDVGVAAFDLADRRDRQAGRPPDVFLGHA